MSEQARTEHQYQAEQDPQYGHLYRPRCSCGWRASGYVAAGIARRFHAIHVREARQARQGWRR